MDFDKEEARTELSTVINNLQSRLEGFDVEEEYQFVYLKKSINLLSEWISKGKKKPVIKEEKGIVLIEYPFVPVEYNRQSLIEQPEEYAKNLLISHAFHEVGLDLSRNNLDRYLLSMNNTCSNIEKILSYDSEERIISMRKLFRIYLIFNMKFNFNSKLNKNLIHCSRRKNDCIDLSNSFLKGVDLINETLENNPLIKKRIQNYAERINSEGRNIAHKYSVMSSLFKHISDTFEVRLKFYNYKK